MSKRIANSPFRETVLIQTVLMMALFAGAWASAAWGAGFDDALAILKQCEALRGKQAAALKNGQYEAATQAEDELQRRLREARAQFEGSGIHRSADVELVLAYAQVLHELKEYDLAAAALEPIVQRNPEAPELLVQWGESLAAVGPARREEAFDALHRAVGLGDTAFVWRAQAALGMLYWREGLYDFALEQFNAAHTANPADVRLSIAIAASRCRAGDILEASRMLDALGRAAQPFDVETRVMLREALHGFDTARRHFPDTAENHAAYAKLLYRAGRVTDALLAAQRTVRLDKNDSATWNFLAAMQLQIGNVPQARHAYEQSLNANPEQPQVRQALESLPKN